DAAYRQNLIADLQAEVRNYQRIYSHAQAVADRRAYENRAHQAAVKHHAEEEAAERRREAMRTPEPTRAPRATPAPTVPPTPSPTPSPTPAPDFGERMDRAMTEFWWVALVVIFFAVTLSTFLTMRIVDNRNQRHTLAAAVLIGAGVGALALVPVF